MIKSLEGLMLMFLNAYANRENSTKAKRIGRKKKTNALPAHRTRSSARVKILAASHDTNRRTCKKKMVGKAFNFSWGFDDFDENRRSVVRSCFGGKSIPPG